jgi:hypothetical protein
MNFKRPFCGPNVRYRAIEDIGYFTDMSAFGGKADMPCGPIGKTGTGKSTLIETMALQDLERGNGFALIDPHGDLVGRIAAAIPSSQRNRVIYLNAADPAQPYGYNPLRHVREDRIALAASGMMEVFKKMWPDAWGVRMEHILRNVLMALWNSRTYWRRRCSISRTRISGEVHTDRFPSAAKLPHLSQAYDRWATLKAVQCRTLEPSASIRD